MIRAFAILIASALCAAGFSPVLNLIEPRGGKRGTEIEIQLIGDQLFEPQELLLYKEGITVKSLEKGSDPKSAKAILVIAPDAELGEHPIRLRCKSGLTYMRTFWVGQFETVMEARSEDNKRDLNNEFNEPQKIALNVTVQGFADQEDADYYQVEAKKGDRLSVEVEGMRLGRVMFDPYVAILDKNRFELAVSDDSALLKRDCATSIIVPEDGPYTILVRESAYEGSPSCQYRIHVGSFPRPTGIYPPAAKPNEDVEFTFIGDPGGEIKTTIKTPAESFSAFASAGGSFSPSGNPVHISPLNYLNESEPNEGRRRPFRQVIHRPPLALFTEFFPRKRIRIGSASRPRKTRIYELKSSPARSVRHSIALSSFVTPRMAANSAPTMIKLTAFPIAASISWHRKTVNTLSTFATNSTAVVKISFTESRSLNALLKYFSPFHLQIGTTPRRTR